jgi:hypothetical protein
MVPFLDLERTQVASDIQVMNDTTPIHGISILRLLDLESRYRKRKPKEEWTATGVISVVVISVVVISVVVIIPSVIAPASRVVIAPASAVGVAPASAVGTSHRVVISSVRLARDHPDYY